MFKPPHTKLRNWRPYDFNKEQVRVLLFRECDWRGRKLLFDSQSFQKLSNEKSCSKLKFGGRPQCDVKGVNGFSPPSNGCPLQSAKTNTDVSMLGEMIFGSVGMTFKGSAFKVHKIKSPTQLMCSKVFLSPKYHRKHLSSDRSLDESCDSSFNSQSEASVHRSSSDNRLASRTGPLDVPWNLPHGNLYLPVPLFHHASEEDSGFCGDTSLLSVPTTTSSGFGWSSGGGTSFSSMGQSVGVPSHQGSGSFQSMQRRWLRSLHTSMELFCQNPSTCSWCSGLINPGFSCGNACIDGIEENQQPSTMWAGGRRPKIGLAVVVTLIDPLKEQQSDKDGQSGVVGEEKGNREAFFFEHASVVEEMLDRFRFATEKACYARKEVFIPLIMDACTELKQALLDLFTAPRLSRPVWLGLLGQSGAGGQNHSTIALGFLEQLCQSLSNLDTKATNFFISTLITAVLTHHLGWVQTVVPEFSSRKERGSNGYSQFHVFYFSWKVFQTPILTMHFGPSLEIFKGHLAVPHVWLAPLLQEKILKYLILCCLLSHISCVVGMWSVSMKKDPSRKKRLSL
ncbi:hypothetical protein J437_LFUL008004 [Ladona fulva]|uniref:UDENN FNIP1/2-type domain-containing protein n=1 Tax=Ladona fulva TaxID=123851 RepID=A0A8K0NZR2_LADFU|nr:hypothetical protein J437_LFUL008004 [Ladona fulva]